MMISFTYNMAKVTRNVQRFLARDHFHCGRITILGWCQVVRAAGASKRLPCWLSYFEHFWLIPNRLPTAFLSHCHLWGGRRDPSLYKDFKTVVLLRQTRFKSGGILCMPLFQGHLALIIVLNRLNSGRSRVFILLNVPCNHQLSMRIRNRFSELLHHYILLLFHVV